MNYDALNINAFMSATNIGRDRMLRELRRSAAQPTPKPVQKKPLTPFKAPQPAVPVKSLPSTR